MRKVLEDYHLNASNALALKKSHYPESNARLQELHNSPNY